MADEPENLTLRMLRGLDAKLDRVLATQEDHTRRLLRLERRLLERDDGRKWCPEPGPRP
jgi:hypothetical protein